MSLARLWSLILKETWQLRRDRRMVRLFLVAPLLQLLIFGYAVSTDLKGVQLGVVMQDPSPEARRLVQAIMATNSFVLKEQSADPNDVRGWLDSGAVQVALHVPPGFAASIQQGETPVVQVVSDGADSNTATLAFQYLSGAAISWAGSERATHLRTHPQEAVRFARVPALDYHPRFWYNPDLRSVNFLVPGVIALILITLMITSTSLMVVKEREVGTLEQLSVTPVLGAELLIAKTVPLATVGLVITVLITAVTEFWFQVPLRGSPLFLLLCAALILLNTTGLGLLVSIISRTQLQAQLTANFIITPLILLSGFLMPIRNMPQWAQWITVALPTRYCMEVVRGVFLKGLGFAELWPQVAALTGLGILFYAGGVLMFRKRVD